MIRNFFPLVLLAPLAIAACSTGMTQTRESATTTTMEDKQARETAEHALQVAQQAEATAEEAKREADRSHQTSLQK